MAATDAAMLTGGRCIDSADFIGDGFREISSSKGLRCKSKSLTSAVQTFFVLMYETPLFMYETNEGTWRPHPAIANSLPDEEVEHSVDVLIPVTGSNVLAVLGPVGIECG